MAHLLVSIVLFTLIGIASVAYTMALIVEQANEETR